MGGVQMQIYKKLNKLLSFILEYKVPKILSKAKTTDIVGILQKIDNNTDIKNQIIIQNCLREVNKRNNTNIKYPLKPKDIENLK